MAHFFFRFLSYSITLLKYIFVRIIAHWKKMTKMTNDFLEKPKSIDTISITKMGIYLWRGIVKPRGTFFDSLIPILSKAFLLMKTFSQPPPSIPTNFIDVPKYKSQVLSSFYINRHRQYLLKKESCSLFFPRKLFSLFCYLFPYYPIKNILLTSLQHKV